MGYLKHGITNTNKIHANRLTSHNKKLFGESSVYASTGFYFAQLKQEVEFNCHELNEFHHKRQTVNWKIKTRRNRRKEAENEMKTVPGGETLLRDAVPIQRVT